MRLNGGMPETTRLYNMRSRVRCFSSGKATRRIQTTSEKASALQCKQKRSSKQTAMRRNSSRRKQAVQHCRTDESKLQAVQHCLKHGSGVQHCCILCYVLGEADVAQELIIFAHTAGAAVGIEFHATMLTLVQIRQVARCATQPAAGGIT